MTSRVNKCLTCDFKVPVDSWPGLTTWEIKVLCIDCIFRYCTRCEFQAPLKTWKMKAGGVPGTWCENTAIGLERKIITLGITNERSISRTMNITKQAAKVGGDGWI